MALAWTQQGQNWEAKASTGVWRVGPEAMSTFFQVTFWEEVAPHSFSCVGDFRKVFWTLDVARTYCDLTPIEA
jgi:hypothetical protein